MNVGLFYLNQKNYLAALKRYQKVIDDHSESKYTPEALHRLVEIYSSLGMIEEAKKRDPLKLLREQLLERKIMDLKEDTYIHESAKDIVNKATEEAENAPYPETVDFFKHVYAE